MCNCILFKYKNKLLLTIVYAQMYHVFLLQLKKPYSFYRHWKEVLVFGGGTKF